MSGRLVGRAALVTGGGTGIGRAVALRLAAEGAAVAVSGRRETPLADTVNMVAAHGGTAVAVSGDVSLEKDAERMVRTTVEELGHIDVLVASAGTIARNVLVHELSLERWEEQTAVNLRGVFLVARAALHAMLKGDGDRSIVTVSSQLARLSARGVAAYAAAKGGVESFTRAIALEYGNRGIRANCVAPATVDTPMARVDREDFENQRDKFASLYPLGRLGVPEDVAAAVAYLASSDAAWVTGTLVTVDGGLAIR